MIIDVMSDIFFKYNIINIISILISYALIMTGERSRKDKCTCI